MARFFAVGTIIRPTRYSSVLAAFNGKSKSNFVIVESINVRVFTSQPFNIIRNNNKIITTDRPDHN